jgi:mono/diheme cytochrome c family protein
MRFLRTLLTVLAGWIVSTAPAHAQQPAELAAQARTVLKQYCIECHGQNPKKLKGALNLFDRSHLDDKERNIVVAKKPDESELFKQVSDGSMPPGNRPKLKDEEKKILRDWILAGAPAFADEKPAPAAKEDRWPGRPGQGDLPRPLPGVPRRQQEAGGGGDSGSRAPAQKEEDPPRQGRRLARLSARDRDRQLRHAPARPAEVEPGGDRRGPAVDQ